MLSSIVIFIVSLTVLIYSSDRFIGASENIGLGIRCRSFRNWSDGGCFRYKPT